jgi:hypothetical protein
MLILVLPPGDSLGAWGRELLAAKYAALKHMSMNFGHPYLDHLRTPCRVTFPFVDNANVGTLLATLLLGVKEHEKWGASLGYDGIGR